MTTVVAGILERDGRVLVCRRRADQDHPGKWEYPGGKVEPGETPADALRRELEEELRVQCVIGYEIERYRFIYSGPKAILLIFLRVESWNGEPDFSQFADAAWASAEELLELPFLEGDVEFNRRFAAQLLSAR